MIIDSKPVSEGEAKIRIATLESQLAAVRAELDGLRDKMGRAQKGIDAVAALIDESNGVTGLHLNGDVAPWDELRTGGRYEEWLVDFDTAYLESDEYRKEMGDA